MNPPGSEALLSLPTRLGVTRSTGTGLGADDPGLRFQAHIAGYSAPPSPLVPKPMKAAISWSDEAEQLLREVPFFVRPAVRRRIEALALEAGLSGVDGTFYQQARASFGRKRAGDDVEG